VTPLTRRQLIAATGAAGAGLVAGCGASRSADPPRPAPPVGADGSARQHAWTASLTRDAAGNVLPPRHQALLVCELAGDPTPARAAEAEAALRRVERATVHAGSPLHVAVGWGPAWFAAVGLPSPVPRPRALSTTELPDLEDPVAVVHLGCDDEAVLRDAADALAGTRPFPHATGATGLDGLLRVTERREGFVGAGLPRQHQVAVTGLPQRRPLPRDAPLYMGFQSGLRRNQATEDDVTIADGRWRHGTTMHVSRIVLSLDSWYDGLDDTDRVRRMFRADATPEDVHREPGGLANPRRDLAAVARRHHLVGHAQSMASARRGGRPVILRRDFNGTGGDQATTHFVALQRTIADFERTREAMNASRAVGASPSVGQQVNNGISEWITVSARMNLLVPRRAERICPGLHGWAA
jgi:hypothetical protein